MRVRNWLFVATASAALSVCGIARADLTGAVKLDGKAPEQEKIDMSGVADCAKLHPDDVMKEEIVANDKGELKNVVVAIKKEDSPDLNGPLPKEPAMIDQKGCMYSPHVLAMMVGQELLIKNSDPFLHNIHSLSTINPAFNKGQPNVNNGEKVDPPKAPETFHVKCDVHAWMSCYIAVFDHPFFSVSDDAGKFAIKGLPDGDYTVMAWHEKLGTQEQKVTVKDGKGEVNFTFKAEGAMAPQTKDLILASDKGSDKSDWPDCCGAMTKAAAVSKAVGVK